MVKQSDHFYLGSSGGNARPFGGQLAAFGIWDTSTLDATDIEYLVADYYNGGTGTVDIPRQDVLVDFVLLQASGEIDGEAGGRHDRRAHHGRRRRVACARSQVSRHGRRGGHRRGRGVAGAVGRNCGDLVVAAGAECVVGDGGAVARVEARAARRAREDGPCGSSGSVPAAAVSASSTVAAPPALAVGDAPASIPFSSEVVADVAMSTGDVPAPSVSGGGSASVSAVAAAATGDLVAPSLSAGVTIAVVPADAVGDLLAPALSLGATIAAPAMLGAGDMPLPFVTGSGSAQVFAVPMLSVAGLLAPDDVGLCLEPAAVFLHDRPRAFLFFREGP